VTPNKIAVPALHSPMPRFFLAVISLAIAALIATLIYAAFSLL
jgi:hypothetical protein